MNLSLNYARGGNNTISVADKQHIYLGGIMLNSFRMIIFEQERALSPTEQHEIRMVCQRLQQLV